MKIKNIKITATKIAHLRVIVYKNLMKSLNDFAVSLFKVAKALKTQL